MVDTKTWPLAFDPSEVVSPTTTLEQQATRTAPVLRRAVDVPRKGLAIPVGVNKRGGAKIVTGEDNDRKIIFTALSGNDNEHAFQQDPGLGEDMVFDLSDPLVRAKIMARINVVFDDFEVQNRYRLQRDTIKWTEDPDEQELTLEFKFLNLESDEVKDFTQGFNAES